MNIVSDPRPTDLLEEWPVEEMTEDEFAAFERWQDEQEARAGMTAQEQEAFDKVWEAL